MKKIFAFLLVAAMLVSMFAVTSMAATQSYTLTGVDVAVENGQIVVCTSLDKWAECNPGWSMNLQCTPDGDGYKVVAASSCPQEPVDSGSAADLTEASGFSDQDGDIYVILHDGGENPDVWSLGVGNTVEISDMAEGGKITFSGTASGGSSSDSSEKDYTRIRVSNNVAAGKSYTNSELYRQGGADVQWAYDANAPIAYPDENGSSLTDGKIPATGGYGNANWAGFHYKTPDIDADEGGCGFAWVAVDLGEVTDITECIVYVPATDLDVGAGVVAPYFVKFSVSNDGEEWNEIGHLEEADIKAMDKNVNDFVIGASVKAEVSARYVRAEVNGGGWIFISEVAVIGADNGTTDEGDKEEDKEPEAPVVPVDPTIDFDLGEANADASFNAVIEAPETYVAGEEVTVTLTIKDITVETGLHAVKVNFYYDNNKLELAGLTEGSFSVPAFAEFAEWEDMSKYVEVDGVTMIEVAAATAGDKDGNFTMAKKDGDLVFNIKFVAKADATGDIAVWAPHATVTGSYVGETAVVEYVGNGSSDIIKGFVEPTDDESTEDEPTDNKPGDATSMIVFAIIALVAIAGSAVVIKTRR